MYKQITRVPGTHGGGGALLSPQVLAGAFASAVSVMRSRGPRGGFRRKMDALRRGHGIIWGPGGIAHALIPPSGRNLVGRRVGPAT
jgi:hypothetical protein